eukprot:Partr_v1_DN23855_c0_g1_i4_m63873 putative Dynein, axonemal, light chain 1
MAKASTVKDALKLWEEKTKQPATEAEQVKLMGVMPPINKIDPTLASMIPKVKHLSLGSNQIDKISSLQGLSCLTILSLGRNNIKKIEGLEGVADTLEELWLSYNNIDKVNGVECCKKLKVLYMAQNKIKAWDGLDKLKDMPALVEILLTGNPLEEKLVGEGTWRDEVAKRFPKLKKLDGKPILRDEEEPAPTGSSEDQSAAAPKSIAV